MAQSEAVPRQSPASGAAHGDGAVIVRSNPYNDLRPFIEQLWLTRPEICRNIFPDQFPRGVNDRGASKEEEDEFILAYFTPDELHKQGGRFLKQVLYSIAKYNEDEVLVFAGRWAQGNPAFYESPNVEEATMDTFLESQQSANHPESFLSRVVTVINYGLKMFRESKPTQDPGSTERGGHHEATTSTDNLQCDDTSVNIGHENLRSSVKDHEQKRNTPNPPRPEIVRQGPSMLHSQPRSARLTPRQPPHRQGQYYHTTHPPGSLPPFHMYFEPMNTPQNVASFTTPGCYSEFDPNCPGFPEVQPQYVPIGYQTSPEPRFITPTVNGIPDQFVPPYGSVHPMGQYFESPTPHQLHTVNFPPGDADVRHIARQSRSGSFGTRAHRSSFSNNGRVVDPDSFTRFPDGYVHHRPYNPRNTRRPSFFASSRPRRLSNRSGESSQPSRESGFFDATQRRVYSDHRPSYSFDGKRSKREARSQSDAAEQRQASAHFPGPSQGFQRRMSSTDFDFDWTCTERRIGNHRMDVTSLVASNLPTYLMDHGLEMFLTQKLGCTRVTPCISHSGLTVFVNFQTMAEAKAGLERNDIYLKKVKLIFKVPFKYWMPTAKGYISPPQIRNRFESQYSGKHYRSTPIHHRQWRTAADSQYHQPANHQHQDYFGTTTSHTRSSSPSLDAANFSTPQAAISHHVVASSVSSSTDNKSAETIGKQVDFTAFSNMTSALVLPPLSEASTPQKKSPKKGSKKGRSIATNVKSSTEAFHSWQSDHRSPQADEVMPEHAFEARPETQCQNDVPSPAITASSEVDDVMVPTALSSRPSDASRKSSSERCDAIVTSQRHQKNREVSPKVADDVDDSFQTAVETPEPATRSSSSNGDGQRPSKPGAVKTPSPDLHEPKALSAATTSTRTDVMDTDHTNSKHAAIVNQSPPAATPLSKKAIIPKPGPRQTESLSPFAKQSQIKKKGGNPKPTKKKNSSRPELERKTNQIQDSKETAGNGKSTKQTQAKGDENHALQTSASTKAVPSLVEKHPPQPKMAKGEVVVVPADHPVVQELNIELKTNREQGSAWSPTKPAKRGATADIAPTGLPSDKALDDISRSEEMIEATSGQVLSRIRSATARLGNAFSSITPAKAKLDASGQRTGQPDGDFKSASTARSESLVDTEPAEEILNVSTADQQGTSSASMLAKSDTETLSHVTAHETSAKAAQPTMKASGNAKTSRIKRKKKPTPTEEVPINPEDASRSTGTTVVETPEMTSPARKTRAESSLPTPVSLQAGLGLNILDTTFAGLDLPEGSVVTVSTDSFGCEDSQAGDTSASSKPGHGFGDAPNAEVERSRRKLHEMAERERLLRQKKI